VLRAYLEERGATLEGATRLAARAGRTVAVVLVVVGLFWDLWLSIIGAFVYFGASAEEAGTIMHVRLRNLVVADVMLIEPLVVGPETEAAWLYDANRHRPQRAFPVVGPNGYEGVVEASSVVGRDPATPVAELEHRTGPTLAPSDAVEGALSAIVNAPGRAVAVVDDGQVVGMVRLEEIEHLLAETPGIGPHPQA
jgi:hypothetical protein